MPMSDYAKDKFVAPELSHFTTANLADLSGVDKEQEHWLANFILNTMLRADVPAPDRQLFYNFLRRSHSAFREYQLARTATLSYLESRDKNLRYVEAIGHWEAMLAYAWQAYCLLGRGKVRWFQKGDGSELQRLNALYNRSKHADSALLNGDYVADSPLCVWLTNDGLRSTDTDLSFSDVEAILRDLARWAGAVQDPLTMREKVLAFEDA